MKFDGEAVIGLFLLLMLVAILTFSLLALDEQAIVPNSRPHMP